MSKPCPATRELTSIFITKSFWSEWIVGERENRWFEGEKRKRACVFQRRKYVCVPCAGSCGRFSPQPKVVRAR